MDEAQHGEFLAKLGTPSTIQIVSLCVKTKRLERIMEELHHIALPVNDIGKAVNWYEKNFDVSKVYEDKSWALLAFENISLALVLPGQHPAHIREVLYYDISAVRSEFGIVRRLNKRGDRRRLGRFRSGAGQPPRC